MRYKKGGALDIQKALALFHCPRYSSLRDNFFSKIDHVISNLKQLSISTLIVQLMNSTDYYINMQLVQFISSCFENERQIIVKFLISDYLISFV